MFQNFSYKICYLKTKANLKKILDLGKPVFFIVSLVNYYQPGFAILEILFYDLLNEVLLNYSLNFFLL